MDIRETLRSLVEKSGKSQARIAEEAGVSKAHLWQLLNYPDKQPGAIVLDKIAQVLGVTVDDILHPEVGTIDEPENNYIFACVRCGSTNYLAAIPHRYHNDNIVGLIYSCKRCWKLVVNGTVAVTYSVPKTDEN